MSNIDTVLVTIHSRQQIPLIRMLGPVLSPIAIERSVADTLKAMGIDVRYHEKKNVKVDRNTGVRELVSESDFQCAPAGAVVTPVTPQPTPALTNIEVTVPDVTAPTELTQDGIGQPLEETTVEDIHDEADTQEETQEEADQEGTAVDLTPDVEDESTLTAEEEVALEAHEEVEVETTEEEQEDESLPVYTREVYATWTKAQLVSYLNGAEEYLPTDVYASLGSVNKTTLLAIVEEHILPLVDSNEE